MLSGRHNSPLRSPGQLLRVPVSANPWPLFNAGLVDESHHGFAVNDNNALFGRPRDYVTFCSRRAAYGRAGFIVAVLSLVVGITALPLFQGLPATLIKASEERPEVLPG